MIWWAAAAAFWLGVFVAWTFCAVAASADKTQEQLTRPKATRPQ